MTVNGGTFNSGRNVTPGPFTITGTLHVLNGGVALAQRGGTIAANAVQIGDGSVNLDGGSTTPTNESRLDVGAGGLTLTDGTINFNAGPSAVGGGSQGSIVRLGGDVISTGTSQFVRLNPGVSNATLDLQGAVRAFNVTGLLQIGTDAAPIEIINGGIQESGPGNLLIAGSQTLTSLDIGSGSLVTIGSTSPPPAPAEAFLAPSAEDGGTAAVPEPGSWTLLWLGTCALLAARRKNGIG